MQKSTFVLILTLLLMSVCLSAQNGRRLSLPNLEQLSSQRVLHLLQDDEGFLWYATDGGGVCRDDGRQVDVFRNDAEHPDLLGSNTVVCLAEAGQHIIIGTSHGANVLDKRDYSIRRLTEVADKRVDDIIVTGNGHWLRRQRRRFLAAMRSLTPDPSPKEDGVDPTSRADTREKSNHSPLLERGAGSEVAEASWLKKAIAQVEAHLDDEGYTVEQLSCDMCMSRMTFYRKIQSATGHTPTEFMRAIRLRRAAELLREGHKTVTEISYATGFSSVSYFSRCFRAMYGVPPTQF